jgi:predicted transcriptional regulator
MSQHDFTRRERQAMDAVHELGEATAKEVQQKLPPPSYSAVRAVLTRLVELGHLRYRQIGPRYVYSAAEGKKRVRQAALRRLVDTFFEGSALNTINALLGIALLAVAALRRSSAERRHLVLAAGLVGAVQWAALARRRPATSAPPPRSLCPSSTGRGCWSRFISRWRPAYSSCAATGCSGRSGSCAASPRPAAARKS